MRVFLNFSRSKSQHYEVVVLKYKNEMEIRKWMEMAFLMESLTVHICPIESIRIELN